MSIWRGNRKIAGISAHGRKISAVYRGARKVWSYIAESLCCYSNGRWIDSYPWKDDDYWND